jgi:hypothetical protein
MSRRCHHGSPRHTRPGGRERRRPASPGDRPTVVPRLLEPAPSNDQPRPELDDLPSELDDLPPDLDDAAILEATAAIDREDLSEPVATPPERPQPAPRRPAPRGAAHARGPDAVATTPLPVNGHGLPGNDPAGLGPERHGPEGHGQNGHEPDGLERTATAPQLRRFIKSRAYVPMHELRRRFAINGGDDDVTPIELDRQLIYVGLPPREGSLLGELLRAGDIGYELSMDPIAPIVVGVYPMRPVPRS